MKTKHGCRKRFISAIAAAVMTALLALLPGGAAEGGPSRRVPSIFYNDEAWFKDEVLPSVMRNGDCYVPAEFFSMVSNVTYSVRDDDNILIYSRNGRYISILFSNGSAVANGEYAGYVGIFRDSGVYYVRAEDVAGPLGLQTEYCAVPGDASRSVIRFSDRDTSFTLEELVNSYAAPPADPRDLLGEDLTSAAVDEKKKICFILVPSEEQINDFMVLEMLDDAGLKYTVFLDAGAAPEEILKAAYQGDYGIWTKDTESKAVDELTDEFAAYTAYRTRLLLADPEKGQDPELVKNGYIYITPDLHVTGGANAAEIYGRILELTREKNHCIIRLDDCWNSEQIIRLIQRLDKAEYSVVNLRGR